MLEESVTTSGIRVATSDLALLYHYGSQHSRNKILAERLLGRQPISAPHLCVLEGGDSPWCNRPERIKGGAVCSVLGQESGERPE